MRKKGRWKDIIVSKYGTSFDRDSASLKFQTWWWRDLCKSCGEGEAASWFQGAIEWKVGGGDKVRFWEDA